MKLLLLISALFLAGFIKEATRPATNASDATDSGRNKSIVFCAPSFDPEKAKETKAPLINGIGKFSYKVSTKSSLAQKYFNQGLALTYGFNHGEAARSFHEVARLDSTCAMAYWGLALVLGPNYNASLNPVSLAEINDAIDKAVKYSPLASTSEKMLIQAMRERFPREEVKDMTPFYEAYASAMRKTRSQFPDDADIATLCADALMNLHPWNLWLKDGSAQPWTPEIMDILGKAVKKFPDHPGVMHYYIHAIEASRIADEASPVADRLRNIMPASGHLIHMPSHIYIRTGEYHKGVLVNEQASEADSSYIAQCKVQGAYPMMYYPHNIHFLAACAYFEGNTKKAIDAAWNVSKKVDRQTLAESLNSQHFYVIPYYVLVQLAKWDEILALPQPGESLKYPVAMWHYARGMAFSAKNEIEKASTEFNSLKVAAVDESLKTALIWESNNASDLVNIAFNVLGAEIAIAKNDLIESEARYRKAIEIEDHLNYMEPPDWFFSVRHHFGYLLIKTGKFAEAEKIYREDLATFPENGYALMGLYNSLKAQGKKQEAKAVKERFDRAWKFADIKLTASRVK
ncbi:MAG: hypothetical protein H7Y27_16450 [Gemmatimonadaceae bacterium]|nr:hypothetical protein [Chitinophagaceae bacterium]